jgi:hypothetical protein
MTTTPQPAGELPDAIERVLHNFALSMERGTPPGVRLEMRETLVATILAALADAELRGRREQRKADLHYVEYERPSQRGWEIAEAWRTVGFVSSLPAKKEPAP